MMNYYLKTLMQNPNLVEEQIQDIFKQEPQKLVLNIVIENEGNILL